MKALIAALRRAIIRGHLSIARMDLAFMERIGPLALREQRAHVRALADQLDTLESDLCAPLHPRRPSADEVRARAERKLKEALL